MKQYYAGNFKEEAPAHRGWIVGTFIDEGPRKTEKVELKYWEFPVGLTNHPEKTSATFECTIVISGVISGMIDGKPLTLGAGQYIVINPGTPNNLVAEVKEPAIGFTIKAPSDSLAKKVIKDKK